MTHIFLVIKRDTVEQSTAYIVRAENEERADELVNNGMFIEESAATILDIVDSRTDGIIKVSEEGKGQEL